MSKYNLQKQAIVDKKIEPPSRGRVKYDGTYWWAYCLEKTTLEVGENVLVVDIDNITLIVEPLRY